MTTPTGQKRQGRILLLILLTAILLDKLWVSRVMPQASGLISINPMIVFLDIPVDLFLTFGLLSVTGIFILLYVLLILPYHSRHNDPTQGDATRQATDPRPWRIITGVLAIPCWVLSGGFLYLAVQPYLPRHASNAIESFGINADIATSFPGYELIHLRGSMVMLVCFIIGMYICLRKIRRAAPEVALEAEPDPVPMIFPELVPDIPPQTAPGSNPFSRRPGYRQQLGHTLEPEQKYGPGYEQSHEPGYEPSHHRATTLRERPEFIARAKPCFPAPGLRVRSYEEL